jgi:hypothetical protein
MDERFSSLKCWEHVEHTLRIIKAGLAPSFWWFNDVLNSDQYIKEQASSETSSVITNNRQEWQRNIQLGTALFHHLYGNIPTQIPDTPPEKVLEHLNFMQTNYSRKVL